MMHATRKLAWIWSITNRTVLPLFVTHEVTLKVKSVVDVAKTKLDVVVLCYCQRDLQ